MVATNDVIVMIVMTNENTDEVGATMIADETVMIEITTTEGSDDGMIMKNVVDDMKIEKKMVQTKNPTRKQLNPKERKLHLLNQHVILVRIVIELLRKTRPQIVPYPRRVIVEIALVPALLRVVVHSLEHHLLVLPIVTSL